MIVKHLLLFFREEDKNIFDYCRENNIDHISKAISSQTVDVNAKDEEVTTTKTLGTKQLHRLCVNALSDNASVCAGSFVHDIVVYWTWCEQQAINPKLSKVEGESVF